MWNQKHKSGSEVFIPRALHPLEPSALRSWHILCLTLCATFPNRKSSLQPQSSMETSLTALGKEISTHMKSLDGQKSHLRSSLDFRALLVSDRVPNIPVASVGNDTTHIAGQGPSSCIYTYKSTPGSCPSS